MAERTTIAAEQPEEPGASPAPPPVDPRNKGRRAAAGVYYGVVAVVCVVSTVQVSLQATRVSPVASPYAGCHEGLAALNSAVERARSAAPGTDGEESAIARFRAALDPEWGFRDGIAATCRGSAPDERALDAIERLRYAEEHAVRREAGELAPLRRKVQAIVDDDLGRKGPPGSTTH